MSLIYQMSTLLKSLKVVACKWGIVTISVLFDFSLNIVHNA